MPYKGAGPVVGGVLALAAVAAGLSFYAPAPPELPNVHVVLAALVYAGVFFFAHRMGFRLRWRGHSTIVSIEEFILVGGLLIIPAPVLVATVGISVAAVQVARRRPFVKSMFNIGQYVLGTGTGAVLFGLLVRSGVPEILASLAGPIAFAFISHGSTAVLFARLQHEPLLPTFRQRFLPWAIVTSVIGMSLGLGAYALWRLHPLATVAVLPLFVLLFRFGRLTEWSEEEVHVHKAIAEASTRMAATGDFAVVAQGMVDTCASVFGAGEVYLHLPSAAGPREWSWRHSQGAGPHGLRVVVPTASGAPGEITIYPRAGQRTYGERDRNLLTIIAASVASAATASGSVQQLQEANARLSNANRELEEFTLWTTHDMREPLRSVAQLAAILHDDIHEISEDEAKDLARRIQRGADLLKERIKALHEFSRIVQEDGSFAPVDLHEIVLEAREGLAARIEERGAVVKVEGRLPVARAQPARIAKVFANLIENALKYNDKPRPVVCVSTRERGEEWEFSVRDNGPGVDPTFRDRAFQLFQRGPGAKESGSGAGLAIVKRIVEQHGGRVWIEGGAGVGADFRFTLPKADALASAPQARAVQVAGPPVP